MFGVYLIHENPYMRTWLYKTILNILPFINECLAIIAILIMMIIVWLLCVIIDYIRLQFIHKCIQKNISMIDEKLNEFFLEKHE